MDIFEVHRTTGDILQTRKRLNELKMERGSIENQIRQAESDIKVGEEKLARLVLKERKENDNGKD